jgi:hypothetical protein
MSTREECMLTLPLLDRLLKSTVVPREAKVAAIESWRVELASARARDGFHPEVERRLADASRLLGPSAAALFRKRLLFPIL